jgi:hypothetical protein
MIQSIIPLYLTTDNCDNCVIMLSFTGLLYLVSTLATTAYPYVLNMNCNRGSETQALNDALDDVDEVAKGTTQFIMLQHYHPTNVYNSRCSGPYHQQD